MIDFSFFKPSVFLKYIKVLGVHMDQYAIYLRKSRADIEAEASGEGDTLNRHKKLFSS